MNKTKVSKILSIFLSFLLIFQQAGLAQVASSIDLSGKLATLRQGFTPEARFRPLHLRYLSYDSINNNFKLLVDKGTLANPKTSELESASKDLLKYFFIGLALPNDTFWVNLRPDSPDEVIDPLLAQTDIGRILLEADVELKKDTALATSPDTKEGKEYWDKLYQKAEELYGTNEVTIPTLTRPWIVPDEVIISESSDSAYIYKATLKVMLEEDYLSSLRGAAGDEAISKPGLLRSFSLARNDAYDFSDDRARELNRYSTQLIKELILPKITQSINTGKKYASLRQVYYSLILASWFKAKNKKQSSSGTLPGLIDSKDLSNLTSEMPYSKDTYFKQYQKSFKEGEYKFQAPVSTPTGQAIRSYFSGGAFVVPDMSAPGSTGMGQRGERVTREPRQNAIPALSGSVTGVEIKVDPQTLRELGILCTGDAGVNAPKRTGADDQAKPINDPYSGKESGGMLPAQRDAVGQLGYSSEYIKAAIEEAKRTGFVRKSASILERAILTKDLTGILSDKKSGFIRALLAALDEPSVRDIAELADSVRGLPPEWVNDILRGAAINALSIAAMKGNNAAVEAIGRLSQHLMSDIIKLALDKGDFARASALAAIAIAAAKHNDQAKAVLMSPLNKIYLEEFVNRNLQYRETPLSDVIDVTLELIRQIEGGIYSEKLPGFSGGLLSFPAGAVYGVNTTISPIGDGGAMAWGQAHQKGLTTGGLRKKRSPDNVTAENAGVEEINFEHMSMNDRVRFAVKTLEENNLEIVLSFSRVLPALIKEGYLDESKFKEVLSLKSLPELRRGLLNKDPTAIAALRNILTAKVLDLEGAKRKFDNGHTLKPADREMLLQSIRRANTGNPVTDAVLNIGASAIIDSSARKYIAQKLPGADIVEVALIADTVQQRRAILSESLMRDIYEEVREVRIRVARAWRGRFPPTDTQMKAIWKAHLTQAPGETGNIGTPDDKGIYHGGSLLPETIDLKREVLEQAGFIPFQISELFAFGVCGNGEEGGYIQRPGVLLQFDGKDGVWITGEADSNKMSLAYELCRADPRWKIVSPETTAFMKVEVSTDGIALIGRRAHDKNEIDLGDAGVREVELSGQRSVRVKWVVALDDSQKDFLRDAGRGLSAEEAGARIIKAQALSAQAVLEKVNRIVAPAAKGEKLSPRREIEVDLTGRPFEFKGVKSIEQGVFELPEHWDEKLFAIAKVIINGKEFKIGSGNYVVVELADGKKVYWTGQHNLTYSLFFEHYKEEAAEVIAQKKPWFHIDAHRDMGDFDGKDTSPKNILDWKNERSLGLGLSEATYFGHMVHNGIVSEYGFYDSVGEVRELAKSGIAGGIMDLDIDVIVGVAKNVLGYESFGKMRNDLVAIAQRSDVCFFTNSSELSRQNLGVPMYINPEAAVSCNGELIEELATAAAALAGRDSQEPEADAGSGIKAGNASNGLMPGTGLGRKSIEGSSQLIRKAEEHISKGRFIPANDLLEEAIDNLNAIIRAAAGKKGVGAWRTLEAAKNNIRIAEGIKADVDASSVIKGREKAIYDRFMELLKKNPELIAFIQLKKEFNKSPTKLRKLLVKCGYGSGNREAYARHIDSRYRVYTYWRDNGIDVDKLYEAKYGNDEALFEDILAKLREKFGPDKIIPGPESLRDPRKHLELILGALKRSGRKAKLIPFGSEVDFLRRFDSEDSLSVPEQLMTEEERGILEKMVAVGALDQDTIDRALELADVGQRNGAQKKEFDGLIAKIKKALADQGGDFGLPGGPGSSVPLLSKARKEIPAAAQEKKSPPLSIEEFVGGMSADVYEILRKGGNNFADIEKKYNVERLYGGRSGDVVFKAVIKGREVAYKFFKPANASSITSVVEALKIVKGNPLFEQYLAHGVIDGGLSGWVATEFIHGEKFKDDETGWSPLTAQERKAAIEELEELVRGMPDEHWDQLAEIFRFCKENDIAIDPSPGNYIYDRQRGFTVIDLSAGENKYSLYQAMVDPCFPLFLLGAAYIGEEGQPISDIIWERSKQAYERMEQGKSPGRPDSAAKELPAARKAILFLESADSADKLVEALHWYFQDLIANAMTPANDLISTMLNHASKNMLLLLAAKDMRRDAERISGINSYASLNNGKVSPPSTEEAQAGVIYAVSIKDNQLKLIDDLIADMAVKTGGSEEVTEALRGFRKEVEDFFTRLEAKARELGIVSGAGEPAPSSGRQDIASSAPDTKGGIDFRSMPIVSRAMANLRAGAAGISISQLKRVDLDKEWASIEQMVSSGIVPSGERIREYLQASSVKGELDKDVDKVISCISEVLRMDEERCSSSDETLKDVLVVLEASRSPAELAEVMAGAEIS